jgi:hypothetical protein
MNVVYFLWNHIGMEKYQFLVYEVRLATLIQRTSLSLRATGAVSAMHSERMNCFRFTYIPNEVGTESSFLMHICKTGLF